MKISTNSYQTLLDQVIKIITQSQENINKEKVLTYWNIGKSIDAFIQENNNEAKNKTTFQQLQQDTNIPKSTLSQMRNFYTTYPDISQNNHLSWSHYRNLLTIKSDDDRHYFENLIQRQQLPVRQLQQEIRKLIPATTKNKSAKASLPKKPLVNKPTEKLPVTRGNIFHYKITTLENSPTKYVDCGFNIFHEINTPLNSGDMAQSSKSDDGYIFEKSNVSTKLVHTYKASLERFVDGDTLRVTLDLGFKIKHREILRLAKINAPELKTLEGKQSAKKLQELLKDVKFLIIKTSKIDIYGRYIADIFFDPKEQDPHKVAKNGIYLNQLLIDQNIAQPY